ncbi:cyanoexosortase B [Leptolyngbya cf. ectocarpi LEGE 11479]|uniref:Cyanoexosortase B n=1 Tax=Leptolyngbya cf. ectocarpi LEGE 11479 TaxID=1828722 RepID=A0A928WZN9_LEPEC|nr:cyanoexosortase B [Leptolyngbya ectocarpi]MBE9066277.1 cyanoexosortase B [Leptolyngbya cf. ectocarpi LEGE 11479]
MISIPPTKSPRWSIELATLSCLAILYGPLLFHWVWDGWINKNISIQHEYFSHGILGIPLAFKLVWDKRQTWHQLVDRLHWSGVVCLAVAFVFYTSGVMDAVNLSFPLMLTGLLLCLKGPAGLKLMLFPLVLIVFSTPTQLPYLIEPYILPLQRFIATVAGTILHGLGYEVEVNNIYLSMNQQLVEVAPHCAGLKMLFTSLYMGLILTYWTDLYRSKLRTGIFFVGIISVSVIGNILRNTILTFFHGHSMTAAFHWLHESWGGDVYSAVMLGALVLIVNAIQTHVPATLATVTVQDAGTTSMSSPPPFDF